jgi:hypothetical protein
MELALMVAEDPSGLLLVGLQLRDEREEQPEMSERHAVPMRQACAA